VLDTGGGMRRVADLAHNAEIRRMIWSPDSTWVAFIDESAPGFSLTVVKRDGTAQHSPATKRVGTAIAWTTDGRLLFTQVEDEAAWRHGLYIFDPRGGPAVPVGPPGEPAGALVGVLPGGRILTAADGFHVIHLDGSPTEHTFDPGVNSGVLDPTGRRVAYAKYNGPTTILDLQTRSTITLGTASGPQGGIAGWSPDGRLLAADIDGRTGLYRPDGTVAGTLPSGFHPAFSPRGDQVAGTHLPADGSPPEFEIVDVAGSGRRVVKARVMHWTWAPGQLLAYSTLGFDLETYHERDDAAVCLVDAAGGTRRLVTFRRASVPFVLAWAPDATTLAVVQPTNPDQPLQQG
jgi:hypothetical protein